MRDEVRRQVVDFLRRADCGFAKITACYTQGTALSWWKQWFNWFARKLGADGKPFTDPINYYRCAAVVPTEAEWVLIEEALQELADKPACKRCGGTDLLPDPAGYYCHAVRADGAPLLCVNENCQ